MKKKILIVVVLATLFLLPMTAQAGEIEFTVTVTDAGGVPIENAVVLLIPTSGTPLTDVTDFGGQATFTVTTPVTYTVEASHDDYQDYDALHSLDGDSNLELTIKLGEKRPFPLPGFETVIFILAMMGAIILIKFKKKRHD